MLKLVSNEKVLINTLYHFISVFFIFSFCFFFQSSSILRNNYIVVLSSMRTLQRLVTHVVPEAAGFPWAAEAELSRRRPRPTRGVLGIEPLLKSMHVIIIQLLCYGLVLLSWVRGENKECIYPLPKASRGFFRRIFRKCHILQCPIFNPHPQLARLFHHHFCKHVSTTMHIFP